LQRRADGQAVVVVGLDVPVCGSGGGASGENERRAQSQTRHRGECALPARCGAPSGVIHGDHSDSLSRGERGPFDCETPYQAGERPPCTFSTTIPARAVERRRACGVASWATVAPMTRHVVVTGANRGIGRAIAEAFVANGDTVSSIYRGGDLPEGVTGAIADISDTDAVNRAFDELEEQHGRVRVLIANAGITKDGLLMRMTDE